MKLKNGTETTREEIIKAIRDNYGLLVRIRNGYAQGVMSYPDYEAMLDYIEEHGLPPKKATAACPKCNGAGRVPNFGSNCNCGSGEGCPQHDVMWGMACEVCRGTGKVAATLAADWEFLKLLLCEDA